MKQYKIGDTVTIRQWDDMEKEFGLTPFGSIYCDNVFTKEMKRFCGKQLTIWEIHKPNKITCREDPWFTFSPDMFEQEPAYSINITQTNPSSNKLTFKDGTLTTGVLKKDGKIIKEASIASGKYVKFEENAQFIFEMLTEKEKKIFNIDDYDNNTVMHCDTEEKSRIFCNYLHDLGMCWSGGESYSNYTFYDKVQDNICYHFKKGTHGTTEIAKIQGRTILEFDDFIFPEVEKFVPHLECDDENYGNVGELTDLTLAFGEPLYVGDVVELYNLEDDKKYGNKLICFNGKLYSYYFAIGIAGDSKDLKNGITKNGDWQIRKIKSYKDLEHNEKIGFVTVKLQKD